MEDTEVGETATEETLPEEATLEKETDYQIHVSDPKFCPMKNKTLRDFGALFIV